MAWYRCGGGGVPASLKHDMNVVLNKKFHSLDDYDPKEWPELTNLLGKLPEATATGSIVTFSDGADDVPLKACEVALPASLDEYSSVTVHHTDGQTPPVFSEDYTVSLGRTIYGGTVDVVKGEGQDGYSEKIDMGTLNWRTGSVSGGDGVRFYCYFDDIKRSTAQVNEIVLADGYDSVTAYDTYRKVKGVASDTGSQRVVLYDGDYSTIEDFKQAVSGRYLIYPLATPTDFTFSPIEINSRLGNNTMWSDGDMKVVYRRDIDLALGGQ